MSAPNTETENRRASFRLEDEVTVRVRVLDEEARREIVNDFDAFRIRYCMKSHVQNQISLRRPQLASIRRGKPDVADYLGALEEQIVHLAGHLDKLSNAGNNGVERQCKATLSSTGIRFLSDVALKKNQAIELALLLSTVNTQIVTIGTVIDIEVKDGELYDASVVFSNIHVEDAEVIASHLANLQRIELQTRREQNSQ